MSRSSFTSPRECPRRLRLNRILPAREDISFEAGTIGSRPGALSWPPWESIRTFGGNRPARGEDCPRHGHGQNQPTSLFRTAHINIPIVDERLFTFRRRPAISRAPAKAPASSILALRRSRRRSEEHTSELQ